MTTPLVIGIDALGTEKAPAPEVEGVLSFLRENGNDVRFLMVGREEDILRAFEERGGKPDCVDILHAPDVIEMGEPPSVALRKKPQSSIVMGMKEHKDGKIDAFLSAGNTGAVMAAGLLTMGRIAGVRRPCILAEFPTFDDSVWIVDVGANTDSSAEELYQFAVMSRIFLKRVMNISDPKVALLSNGEEAKKGDAATVGAHALCKEKLPGFVGNVEGRDILFAKPDLIVCDGFVGNIVLKYTESIPTFMSRLFESNNQDKNSYKEMFNRFDPDYYGGVPLLGVNGNVIIAHGNSNPMAIWSALNEAYKMVTRNVNQQIREALSGESAS